MNIGKIFQKVAVNKTVGKLILKVTKRIPEICLVGGIATGVGATVATAVQTAKLEPILDEHKKAMDDIRAKELDEKALRKETAKIYVKTSKKVGKLYALPAALEAASIGFQIGGHNTLRKENAALVAAYMGVSKAYNDYRKNVKETEGTDKDLEHMGADISKDENTGEKVVVMNSNLSPYARAFDAGNPNWTKNPDMNMAFIKGQQITANSMLHRKGFLFLNEVYDLLDIPRSKIGQVVGWVDMSLNGDGFVDFGVYNAINKNAVDEFEPVVWLDFNVDGEIMYIFDQEHKGGLTD